ncbi:MAG: tetratricopeptide repeat protein [Magnetococcales bacterium]|nr:tetratricopeptide repeat protein [Magnetococcales bacterium]
MIHQETLITLSIRAAKDPVNAFMANLVIDGVTIREDMAISASRYQLLRPLVDSLRQLLKEPGNAEMVQDAVTSVGIEMFDLWLGELWSEVESRIQPNRPRLLSFASEIAEVLNLPWELIRPPSSSSLGFNPSYGIRRMPNVGQEPARCCVIPPPRPLRVLALAAAPLDQLGIDFDAELLGLRRAVGRAGRDAVFYACETGSIETLKQDIHRFQPHIVQLIGHSMVRGGQGHFCFEDESGQSDVYTGQSLAKDLFAGSGVQMVCVSGRVAGKPATIAASGAMCQDLVKHGLPLALAWGDTLIAPAGARFAEAMYSAIASDHVVDRALTQARQTVQDICNAQGYPGWILPALYSVTNQRLVFNVSPAAPPVTPPEISDPVVPLPGLIAGSTRRLMGRRAEMRSLLPDLIEGKTISLLITGAQGNGKTTLATALARGLQEKGFQPVALNSTPTNPLTVGRIIDAFGSAFLALEFQEEYQLLLDSNIRVEDRLVFLAEAMNRRTPFVLVLDGLARELDPENGTFVDTALAAFVAHLITRLSGDSRLIMTSRRVPQLPGVTLPDHFKVSEVVGLSEYAFSSLVLDDASVEARQMFGDINKGMLRNLHQWFGDCPALIPTLRAFLRDADLSLLQERLNTTPAESLSRDERLEVIKTLVMKPLFDRLDPLARKALSKIAVFDIPVCAEAMGQVSDMDRDTILGWIPKWQGGGWIHPKKPSDNARHWTVRPFVKHFLTDADNLTEDENVAAHKAAGDFLITTIEEERDIQRGHYWGDLMISARNHYLTGKAFASALDISKKVSEFLYAHGFYHVLINFNLKMLEGAEKASPVNWIGLALLYQNQIDMAQTWLERGLSLALTEGSDQEEGVARRNLALIMREKNDPDSALAHLNLVLKGLSDDVKNRDAQGAILLQMAEIQEEKGKVRSAKKSLEAAIAATQQSGNKAGESAAWFQLGNLVLKQGDSETALEHFQNALAIDLATGNRSGQATILPCLGNIHFNMGLLDKARENFEASLHLLRALDNRPSEAVILHQLATVDMHAQHYDDALKKFRQSLEIKRSMRDFRGESATFFQLSLLAQEMGKSDEAFKLMALCQRLDEQIGHPDAEQERHLFQEMAESLSYEVSEALAIQDEVWESYRNDRGDTLIDEIFKKQTVIPIAPMN